LELAGGEECIVAAASAGLSSGIDVDEEATVALSAFGGVRMLRAAVGVDCVSDGIGGGGWVGVAGILLLLASEAVEGIIAAEGRDGKQVLRRRTAVEDYVSFRRSFLSRSLRLEPGRVHGNIGSLIY